MNFQFDDICLDCDGVLFDSNHFKFDAFIEVASSINYHNINSFQEYLTYNWGQKNRIELINFIVNDYPLTIRSDLREKLLIRYRDLCFNSYLESPLTESCEQFLARAATFSRLHVISKSCRDELISISSNLKTYSNTFLQSQAMSLLSMTDCCR